MKRTLTAFILYYISLFLYGQSVPSDVINIQSGGSTFSPVIEVAGTPTIEWIFDDGTKSSSSMPSKDYGSDRSRHNYLKVTPWSALIGINVGYDAGDEGYGGFSLVANQSVLKFQNLTLAKSSLQYLCASYNPITELDLRELTGLRFIELVGCQNLSTLLLGNHPVLERLCVEDNDLNSLDLSGCPVLEDLRAASNNFTTINWGSVGQEIWHICVRTNPQMQENLPDLRQFPKLKELLIWNDNQTGAFVCNSPVIESIEAYNNHYTSADIRGCTSLIEFSLSGSKLAFLNLGTANNLTNIQLKDCDLTESQVDYIFRTLYLAGLSNGFLELTGNSEPSAEGLIHLARLEERGWMILTDFHHTIKVTSVTVSAEGGTTTITSDNGTLQLIATVLPADATNKSVSWSLINGTGQATISNVGLVTAFDNGTVYAQATANDGSGISGTFSIMIYNQFTTVTGINIVSEGGAGIIAADDGTLQLSAIVSPLYASDKTVTWSLFNDTGKATISTTGLVTAVDNGSVTVWARANDGSGVYGTFIITIYNQYTPVTGIIISGEGGVTTITKEERTLQLFAEVLPSYSTNKNVTWSLTNGTGKAIISTTGLITAIKNGTVTVMVTANDGSGVYVTIDISIALKSPDLPSLIISSDEVKIILNDDYISWKVYLYNFKGSQVTSKLVHSNIVVLDISNLQPGIYLLVLTDGETSKTAKITK
jgi:uncharacterized protein YjdB